MNRNTTAKLLAFSFSLLFFTSLIAQQKVFRGFYVTLNGDTVSGSFPGYSEWSHNPSQVEFITGTQAAKTQLTLQNCRLFVVEGYDEYRPYSGLRLLNPIDDAVVFNERFPNWLDSSEKIETFLRLVTRTPGLELYEFNDRKRANFFYKLPGQPFVELKYKKIYERSQILERFEYKQQLLNLFNNRIEQQHLAASLENLAYRQDELSTFFKDLFPAEKPKQTGHKATAGWVISAGVSLNSITLGADKTFIGFPTKYGTSFSPVLSVGYLLPLERSFGKYFFYPQLRLFRYKNTGELNDGTFIMSMTYQADLLATAEINGGLNVLNTEQVRLYLTGGAGMMAQVNGTETRQLYAASTHAPYGGSVQTKTPALSYSLNASAGLVLNKKILLSATYMIPSLVAGFGNYTARLSGVQLRVGYKLP